MRSIGASVPLCLFLTSADHALERTSSIAELQNYLTALFTPLAHKFNLTLNAFDSTLAQSSSTSYPSSGTLTLTDAWGTGLEPAPPTPVGVNAEPWKVLMGTIKASLKESVIEERREKQVVVSPMLALGEC